MTDDETLARWRAATDRRITRDGAGDALTVRMTRRYDAPVDEVWDACTSAERLARWLGSVSSPAGPLRAGGEALLVMSPHITVSCRIVACQPPHRLAVIWDHPGEPESAAEIKLGADGDGTVLEFEHGRLPAGLAVGYGYGWEDFLDRLGVLLADGDPDAVSWGESQRVLEPLWVALHVAAVNP